MFEKIKQWGEHEIYNYDTKTNNFLQFFENLYTTDDLEQLHHKSIDFNELKHKENLLDDRETDLHSKFYKKIKSDNEFKELYCNFVKDIYKTFFPEEKIMIFQSFPSVRLQFENSITVPPHCDSDELGCHPIGERNFLVPITKMFNSNTLFIESEPGKKDYQPINLEYGNLLYFNGNKCIHYNERNKEGKLRISLDFRIVKQKDYVEYVKNDQIMETNPRNPDGTVTRCPVKMLIGGYYQSCSINYSIEKMMEWYHNVKDVIMQHRPLFGVQEAVATHEYMLDDNFLTEHKKTRELENMISNYLKIKHCLMTTSGTSAILLALMSLELNHGDKVIVPNYTMIATINCIKHLGLDPIIVDVDSDTYTIDIDSIKHLIDERTKAIIHVSLNNRYKKLEELILYCKNNNIYLIEDAAQSLGCSYKDKNLGTFGDIGCFSLSTPKIISTGQGGFVVSNNETLVEKMNMIKNFGRKESGKDNFESFGLNMKFTDLQAVVGIEQMKQLEFRIERMKCIYNLYYNNLKELGIILKPLSNTWIPWFVDIYIDNRDDLVEYLNKHNIKTRHTYGEINKTTMYYSEETLINSNYVSTKGLFLPSYITLTNNQIDYICNIIKSFLVDSKI